MGDEIKQGDFKLMDSGDAPRIVVVPVSTKETTTVRQLADAPNPEPSPSVGPPEPPAFVGPPAPTPFVGPPAPQVVVLPKSLVEPKTKTVIQVPPKPVPPGGQVHPDSLVAPIITAVVIMVWWVANVVIKKKKAKTPVPPFVPEVRVHEEPQVVPEPPSPHIEAPVTPQLPHESAPHPEKGTELVVIVRSNKGCCDDFDFSPGVGRPTAKPVRLRSFSDAAADNPYRRAREAFPQAPQGAYYTPFRVHQGVDLGLYTQDTGAPSGTVDGSPQPGPNGAGTALPAAMVHGKLQG